MLGTLELVCNSDWATIVASIGVMAEVNKGKLVAQPIYGPELWLDFFLYTHQGRTPIPGLS